MIHLLSALPAAGPSRNTMRTPSPAATSSSWDSLPSDADDTFSLSGSEDYEEYEREKKQRWIAALREERLREREKEDVAASNAHPPTSASASSSWPEDEEVSPVCNTTQGSRTDGQPPEAILTLMKHTAKSISTSPNPQLLEMRILANHASDDRFAFLRGRWPEAWESVKERLRRLKMNDPERKKKEEKAVGALLGGYESSDDEEEGQEGPGDEDEEGIPPPPPPPTEEDGLPPPPPSPPDGGHSVPQEQTSDAGIIGETVGEDRDARSRVEETDEEEKKRLRRLKVEEWKRQRAEAKANTLS